MLLNLNIIIMYSSEDLQRLYFQYQTEALPHGESIQSFCVKNKVPYNIFFEMVQGHTLNRDKGRWQTLRLGKKVLTIRRVP